MKYARNGPNVILCYPMDINNTVWVLQLFTIPFTFVKNTPVRLSHTNKRSRMSQICEVMRPVSFARSWWITVNKKEGQNIWGQDKYEKGSKPLVVPLTWQQWKKYVWMISWGQIKYVYVFHSTNRWCPYQHNASNERSLDMNCRLPAVCSYSLFATKQV